MLNRPLICTEYMARRNDSRFCNVLPLMKKEKVGAINWGFVAGKTNTIFAWDDVIPSGEEPELWLSSYRSTLSAGRSRLYSIPDRKKIELRILFYLCFLVFI